MSRTTPPRRGPAEPGGPISPYGPAGFRVEAEAEAVPEARRRVVSVVRGWELPLPEGTYDDLELLASELITNAVRYSGAACAVAVRWTGERVRVEVSDTIPVRPRPRRAAVEAEGGRGLFLVESLSAAWGTTPDPAGKTVWFELGPPEPHAAPGPRRLADQIRAVLPVADSAPHPMAPRRLRTHRAPVPQA
ncbi:ATP-binding protein [Actinacidiphila acididurans]|uniref:ATP-binding protein n=1 Tax=Actinacidiphila acididurans TaxID=2784346 RepID=A0ABS2TK99_9ACTN|nr:ATP-binding protein [Actinacidiphila acididurans]MBM9503763.1 ATP-binding protein [Actinacidiphila acididurans]